eukprot:SAG11_NODE_1672_length_4483_cov_3.470119_3_plen_158_part_00
MHLVGTFGWRFSPCASHALARNKAGLVLSGMNTLDVIILNNENDESKTKQLQEKVDRKFLLCIALHRAPGSSVTFARLLEDEAALFLDSMLAFETEASHTTKLLCVLRPKYLTREQRFQHLTSPSHKAPNNGDNCAPRPNLASRVRAQTRGRSIASA